MRVATPDDAEAIVAIMETEEAARELRGLNRRGPMDVRFVRKHLATGWVGVIDDEAGAFMLCRRDRDQYRIPYMLPSTMGLALGTGLIKLLSETLIARDGDPNLVIGGFFDTELSARAYQGLVEGGYEQRPEGHFVSQRVGIVRDRTTAIAASIRPCPHG